MWGRLGLPACAPDPLGVPGWALGLICVQASCLATATTILSSALPAGNLPGQCPGRSQSCGSFCGGVVLVCQRMSAGSRGAWSTCLNLCGETSGQAWEATVESCTHVCWVGLLGLLAAARDELFGWLAGIQLGVLMPQGRSCCSTAPTRFLSESGESHRRCAAVTVRGGLLAVMYGHACAAGAGDMRNSVTPVGDLCM